MNPILIHVGSTSIHKVQSVVSACKEICSLPIEILEFPAEIAMSGVSDHPFGFKEIRKGATNRAQSVWKPGVISIGIESGVIQLPSSLTWYEKFIQYCSSFFNNYIREEPIYLCLSVVVVIDSKGKIHFTTTSGMQLPPDIVLESMRRKITIGKVLVEQRGKGDHTDPRSILSFGRVFRGDSIKEAVKLALLNIF